MKNVFLFSLIVLLVLPACKKKDKDPEPVVTGCTDSNALNYNAAATQNDGNCQFAEKYFPFKIGNTWTLQDTVEVPVPGFAFSLPVDVVLRVEKDTVMNGKTYFLVSQNFDVQGAPIPVGNILPATRFGYRTDRTGKIYRIVPGESQEYIYLNYPLTVGDTWEDQSASPATYTVTGTQLLYIPGLNKTVTAWKIQVNSGATGGQPVDLYFAKDVGLVRQQISFVVMGFTLGLDAFLQEVQL